MDNEKVGYWAVHAFEGIYGGMHGINNKFVFYGSEKEAWSALEEEARQLFDSYCYDDETDEERFEADGEIFFITEHLSDEQREAAEIEIYEDFVGFAQKVAQGIDLNTILNEE